MNRKQLAFKSVICSLLLFAVAMYCGYALSNENIESIFAEANPEKILLEFIPENIDVYASEDIEAICENEKGICKDLSGNILNNYFVSEKSGAFITCVGDDLKAYGAGANGIDEIKEPEFYCEKVNEEKKPARFKFSVNNIFKFQAGDIVYPVCEFGSGVCQTGNVTCQTPGAFKLCVSSNNQSNTLCFNAPTMQFVFGQCTSDGVFNNNLDTLVSSGQVHCGAGKNFRCPSTNDLRLLKEGSEAICFNAATKKFSPGSCAGESNICQSYSIPVGEKEPCIGANNESTCKKTQCTPIDRGCSSYTVPPGYALPCSTIADERTCTLTGCTQLNCTPLPSGEDPPGACRDFTFTPQYFSTGDGGCKHASTGLVVSRLYKDNVNPSTNSGKTQAEAIAYCESLDEGGRCDWRLPSSIEAVKLINNGLKSWLKNGPYPGQKIWSSTAAAPGTAHAFTLEGQGVLMAPTQKLSVICVRGKEVIVEPGCHHVGISCEKNSDCCTGKCYGNACRNGNERLSRHGEFCLDDYDCVEGVACNLKGYYCDSTIVNSYPNTFPVSWKKIKNIERKGKLNYEGRIQDLGVYRNNLVLYGGSDFINNYRSPFSEFEYSVDGKNWIGNSFSEGFDSASLVKHKGKAYLCGIKDIGSACYKSITDNLNGGFNELSGGYQKTGYPLSDSALVSFKPERGQEKLFRFGGQNNKSIKFSTGLPIWSSGGELPFTTHDRQVIKFLDPRDDFKQKLLAINVYAQVTKVSTSVDGVTWTPVIELKNTTVSNVFVFNNKIVFLGSKYDVNYRDDQGDILPISTIFISKDGGRSWKTTHGIPGIKNKLHYSDIVLFNHRLFQVARTVDNTYSALYTYPSSPILESDYIEDEGGGDDPPTGTPPGACKIENSSFKTKEGGCKHLASGTVVSKQVNHLTHANAVSYCNELTEGGFSDWRLGSLDEYAEVISANNTLPNQSIDYVPPNNSQWSGVWTNTRNPALSSSFYEINWDNGLRMSLGQLSTSVVYCIRSGLDEGDDDGGNDSCPVLPSGQPIPGACTQENASFKTESGGCKEKITELVVSKQKLGIDSWNEARSYCNDLEEGGYCDWKLPTKSELDDVIRVNIHELTSDVNDYGCGKALTCNGNDNAVCCNGNQPRCPQVDESGNPLHSDATSCMTLATASTTPGCCYSTMFGVQCRSEINPKCTSIDSATDLVWATNYYASADKFDHVVGWFRRGSVDRNSGAMIGTFCIRDGYDSNEHAEKVEGLCPGADPKVTYRGCSNPQVGYEDSYGGCGDLGSDLIWHAVSNERYEYEEAKRICAERNVNGYCDWRMPTEDELKRLAASNGSKAISTPINPRSWFDTNNINFKYGWVDISNGFRSLGNATDKNYVTCVRSFEDDDVGAGGSSRKCVKEGVRFKSERGGCHDLQNGLVWDSPIPMKMPWYNALIYCEDFEKNGYKDWRLPKIEEISGSDGIEFNGSRGLENIGLFKGRYWALEEYPNFNKSAYSSNIPGGGMFKTSKIESNYFTCVRESGVSPDLTVGPPKLTSISPRGGNSTTTVIFKGVNLDKVTRITLNEIEAQISLRTNTVLNVIPGRINPLHTISYGNGLSNIKAYYLDNGVERFTVPTGDFFVGGVYFYHTPYSISGDILYDQVHTAKALASDCKYDGECPSYYCHNVCQPEPINCNTLEWSTSDLDNQNFNQAQTTCNSNSQGGWRLPTANEFAKCRGLLSSPDKKYWTKTEALSAFNEEPARVFRIVGGSPSYPLETMPTSTTFASVKCVRNIDVPTVNILKH